jgi:transposase
LVEGKPISIGNVAYVLGMDSKKLSRWYKDQLSGYREALRSGEIGKHDLHIRRQGCEWKVKVPILKPENLGEFMAIDEKSINGQCYTILSNLRTSKIALMASTLKVSELNECMSKFSIKSRMNVKSVTRDLAPNFEWLARTNFMNAYHVADKFHIIREILEQLQSHRIRYRQEILALERKKNKSVEEKLKLREQCSNGDTLRQLLHRSRGLLYKREDEWTLEQAERAAVLFKKYPDLKRTYKYCQRIRDWYRPIRPHYTESKFKTKRAKIDVIIEKGKESEIEEMKNIACYLEKHKAPIVNYFYRRESNAKAEALNQNLQRFIRINYGARDTDFFLFRIAKHFS